MRSFIFIAIIITTVLFAVMPFGENYREITPPPFDGHPPVAMFNLTDPVELPCLNDFPGWIGIPYKWTGLAWKAWGPGVKIPGWSETPDIAEIAARNFIDDHRSAFGTRSEALKTVRCEKHGRVWYLIFEQVADGRLIRGARLDLRVSPDGELFLLGNKLLPNINMDFPPGREINSLLSDAGFALGLEFVETKVGEEFWQPVEIESGQLYIYPVRQIDFTVENPPSKWACYVDVVTGETIMRVNKYYYLSGEITAEVMVAPVSPWNVNHTRNVRWGRVDFGGYNGFADVEGSYSFSASGSSTATHVLSGRYTYANDYSGAEPYFGASASGGDVVNIHMDDSNSELEERSGYVWAMRALYNTKLTDPSFTDMDYIVPCNVNLTSGTCNAYWDGSSINFFIEGGGCENTAQLKDVVMHEYTHGITSAIYDGSGDMPHLSVNECWSDYWPCTDSDDPLLGRGFFGAGTHLRYLDNTLVYPDDWEGESHHDGQILGGALWDMREELGRSYSDTLFQFARYGLPYNFFDNYYEILAVDDDDADLSNGTPNYCAIAYAFNLHGIGDGAEPLLTHTPHGDTDNTTIPYEIEANLLQCPEYSWSAESVLVRWSIDGTSWNTAVMSVSGGVDYTGNIPAQPGGTVIRYVVIAKDLAAHQRTHPSDWPDGYHVFAVGTPVPVFEDDMETDLGWTSGAPGDDASTGQWVRVDPYETYNTSTGLIYQCGDDHSDPGTRCWVTGNAPMSSGAGYADVDGGKVTLLSPIIDLSGHSEPVLKYWRWCTNETSLDDSFWVAASSDGGSSWDYIDIVPQTQNWWTEVTVVLSDHIGLTANCRFAFIATDYRSGSLTEGMIDDFGIFAYVDLGVSDLPSKPDEFSIRAFPNPFNSSIRIDFDRIPESAEIYDISGKRVAVLPRFETVIWPGRSDSARELPSGVYLVVARSKSEKKIEKITLIK